MKLQILDYFSRFGTILYDFELIGAVEVNKWPESKTTLQLGERERKVLAETCLHPLIVLFIFFNLSSLFPSPKPVLSLLCPSLPNPLVKACLDHSPLTLSL